VVHVTRCPMKTISSLVTANACSREAMARAAKIPIPAEWSTQPPIEQFVFIAKLWLHWTKLVSSQSDATVRVEDLSNAAEVRRLCEATVGSDDPHLEGKCLKMEKFYVGYFRGVFGDARKHHDISFSEFHAEAPELAAEIRSLGERLGYMSECFEPDLSPSTLQQHVVHDMHPVVSAKSSVRLYTRAPKAEGESILANSADLCACGNDIEDDDEEFCLCADAKVPNAKEILVAMFQPN